jgi:hypothetical protein
MAFEPISASIMAGLSIGQSLLGSSSASAQRQQEYEAEKGRVQRQNALNMHVLVRTFNVNWGKHLLSLLILGKDN